MKFIIKNKLIAVVAIAIAVSANSCSSISNLGKSGSNSGHKANLWKDNAKQDQVYSCHTFVAAGLVEAEYYRAKGKKINLSEADLFLKHIKHGALSWDAALTHYLARGVRIKNPRNLEIGHVHESYRLIQRYGIAKDREIKYAPAGRIGIPLSMRILRTSVENIKDGIKEGKSQAQLTVQEIALIKKTGAFKILSQEEKYFSSREMIKQFASQYTLKSVNIRYKPHSISLLRSMLSKGRIIGIDYRVPSHKAPSKSSGLNHTLILTGFDEKKQVFTVRNSDSKGLFGNYPLTTDFIRKQGTKIYYLEKR